MKKRFGTLAIAVVVGLAAVMTSLAAVNGAWPTRAH